MIDALALVTWLQSLWFRVFDARKVRERKRIDPRNDDMNSLIEQEK